MGFDLAGVAALGPSDTAEQFEAWGWRIPFLVSLILLGVSVWIRLKLNMSNIAKPQATRRSGNWAGTSVHPRSTMNPSIDSETEFQLSSKPKMP